MSFPRVVGYVVVSKIGSGSYSTVYKAYTKVGPRTLVAIKCISKCRVKQTTDGVDKLLTEIRLLKTLRHPHIVLLHDFLWDDKNIYIVLEHCDTDLAALVRRSGRLAERTALYLLQQLASALRFLREKGVAHMDLKPHNLLLSKNRAGRFTLKVADFGFAQYLSADALQSELRGSPLYMAPEMLSRKELSYGPAVDLWSVGVIMYECLFGHAPYRSATLEQLLQKIITKQPIEFPAEIPISDGCADLLSRLLQHDPAKRISHEEFFNHEYLDLEHMPSPENYEKAVGLLCEAMRAEGAGEVARALALYCDSLQLLVPLARAEPDPQRRRALGYQLAQYMERAELLKAQLVGGPPRHAASEVNGSTREGAGMRLSRGGYVSFSRARVDRQESVADEGSSIAWDIGGADVSAAPTPADSGAAHFSGAADRATDCEDSNINLEKGRDEKTKKLIFEEPQRLCRVQ